MDEHRDAFYEWVRATLLFLRTLLGLPARKETHEEKAGKERIAEIKFMFLVLRPEFQDHVVQTTLKLYERQRAGQRLPSKPSRGLWGSSE